MAEYSPTVVSECLRVVICTRNRNPDAEAFRKGVVEPYQRVKKIQEQLEKEQRVPSLEEMRDALAMLTTAFKTKLLPEQEQQEWFSEILVRTGTQQRFPDLVKIRDVQGSGVSSSVRETGTVNRVAAAGGRFRVFLFPGQGAQRRGMGDTLFAQYPELVRQADEILGYSIQALCSDDPDRKLADTRYTQPAIYTVSALSYLRTLDQGVAAPDLMAGHSVGEFGALFAAGAFDFATGLKLVKRRGGLMAAQNGGGMAALIGLSREEIEILLRDSEFSTIDIANLNLPLQTVVSGPREDILKARTLFEQAGADQYVPLDVSAAFHSRYMQPVKADFAKYLAEFQFSPTTVPVLSNYSALPHTPQDIKRNLAEQIDHPVRWVECMQHMLVRGDPEFQELEPGEVLSKMLRQMIQSRNAAAAVKRARPQGSSAEVGV